MKLGHRLLLIVGHTLGDFALPLMRTQCKRAGTTLEGLTSAQAERVLPVVEQVLSGFVVRPADLDAIMHELRVEVGAERFAEAGRERAAGAAGAAGPGSAETTGGGAAAAQGAPPGDGALVPGSS